MLRDAAHTCPLRGALNSNDCRFYGVTAEFGTARLKKVIGQTVSQ